jgi:hypothetical protein
VPCRPPAGSLKELNVLVHHIKRRFRKPPCSTPNRTHYGIANAQPCGPIIGPPLISSTFSLNELMRLVLPGVLADDRRKLSTTQLVLNVVRYLPFCRRHTKMGYICQLLGLHASLDEGGSLGIGQDVAKVSYLSVESRWADGVR